MIFAEHPEYPGHLIADDGSIISKRTGRRVFVYHHRSVGRGDENVRLYHRVSGQYHFVRIANLVCTAFHGYAPVPGMHVNHVDGNFLNNSAANLEWLTPSENITHAFKNGLIGKVRGADHPASIFTEDQVHAVLKARCNGAGYNTIANLMGFKRDSVRKICGGRTWRHVWVLYKDRLPVSMPRYDLRRRTDEDNRLIAHEVAVLPLDAVSKKWHFRHHSDVQRIAKNYCDEHPLFDETLLDKIRKDYWNFVERWSLPDDQKMMRKFNKETNGKF